MNSTKIYILLAFFLLTFSVFAQEKPRTLDACINHAIEHNISIKQIEIGEQNKSVNLELAKYDFLLLSVPMPITLGPY